MSDLGTPAAVSVMSVVSVVMLEQFGGGEVAVFVQDLYFISNDPNDVVLAAFDLQLEPTAQIDYDQAPLAYGGNPGNIGGIFDTESVRRADWFVTIGGFGSDASTPLQIPGAGGDTQFDPNFGVPDTAYPDAAAGWFNSVPSTLAGAVHDTPLGTRGTFIGRFSYLGYPWDSPLYKSRISGRWGSWRSPGCGVHPDAATETPSIPQNEDRGRRRGRLPRVRIDENRPMEPGQSTAWAAASRATGTRNGEQLT